MKKSYKTLDQASSAVLSSSSSENAIEHIKKTVKLPEEMRELIRKELEPFKKEVIEKNPRNLNLKDQNQRYSFFGYINLEGGIPDEFNLVADGWITN